MNFKQSWGNAVPSPVMEMGEKFQGALPKLLDRLAAPPVTISHGTTASITSSSLRPKEAIHSPLLTGRS